MLMNNLNQPTLKNTEKVNSIDQLLNSPSTASTSSTKFPSRDLATLTSALSDIYEGTLSNKDKQSLVDNYSHLSPSLENITNKQKIIGNWSWKSRTSNAYQLLDNFIDYELRKARQTGDYSKLDNNFFDTLKQIQQQTTQKIDYRLRKGRIKSTLDVVQNFDLITGLIQRTKSEIAKQTSYQKLTSSVASRPIASRSIVPRSKVKAPRNNLFTKYHRAAMVFAAAATTSIFSASSIEQGINQQIYSSKDHPIYAMSSTANKSDSKDEILIYGPNLPEEQEQDKLANWTNQSFLPIYVEDHHQLADLAPGSGIAHNLSKKPNWDGDLYAGSGTDIFLFSSDPEIQDYQISEKNLSDLIPHFSDLHPRMKDSLIISDARNNESTFFAVNTGPHNFQIVDTSYIGVRIYEYDDVNNQHHGLNNAIF
jgi:hypothetical protein